MTRRKGARRIAEIPPDVLRDLNAGRTETVNLVEWLAIDMAALLGAVLPEAKHLARAARERSELGVMRRLHAIGEDLHLHFGGRKRAFEAVARHPSDMARAFAAYALRADGSLSLPERLARTRRFAADRSMAVRECAWDSLRPHLAADLDRAIGHLRSWVADGDPSVRRCALEATRPRGVWCAHIGALKQRPERGLPLLEPVRADKSRCVLTSASNWLNDASKSRPEWVLEVCGRWRMESPSDATEWLCRRATRTIAKA